MLTDPISDMLTTIRNGQNVRLVSVSTPASKLKAGILNVFKEEGYIKDFEEVEVRPGIKRLNIQLSYFKGEAVIKELKRVSRPGLRNYSKVDNMPKIYNGLGLSILSTSKGVLPDYKARQQNVGGEIICKIY